MIDDSAYPGLQSPSLPRHFSSLCENVFSPLDTDPGVQRMFSCTERSSWYLEVSCHVEQHALSLLLGLRVEDGLEFRRNSGPYSVRKFRVACPEEASPSDELVLLDLRSGQKSCTVSEHCYPVADSQSKVVLVVGCLPELSDKVPSNSSVYPEVDHYCKVIVKACFLG